MLVLDGVIYDGSLQDINPMDIELEENMDDVLRLKSELILSFCEIVMDGKRNIPAEANSVYQADVRPLPADHL